MIWRVHSGQVARSQLIMPPEFMQALCLRYNETFITPHSPQAVMRVSLSLADAEEVGRSGNHTLLLKHRTAANSVMVWMLKRSSFP